MYDSLPKLADWSPNQLDSPQKSVLISFPEIAFGVWHSFSWWKGLSSSLPEWLSHFFPGVQRKGKGGTNIEGEVELLALAGQRLAEGHAL